RVTPFSQCSSHAAPTGPYSIPKPQAGNDTPFLEGLTAGTQQVSASPVAAGPSQADIGRELPANLVAQAQGKVQLAQSTANAKLRHGIKVVVQFQARLQNQTLREQQFVLHFKSRREIALLTDKRCQVGLEPVRRQTLDAE